MDRDKVMRRLERLEPKIWYIVEDLSETYISVYGFEGIEEVIQESGISHIKNMLKDSNVSETVKEEIRRYFDSMAKGKEV